MSTYGHDYNSPFTSGAVKYHMHLHNYLNKQKIQWRSTAVAQDPHRNEFWIGTIMIGQETFVHGPTVRKQEALDLAAKKALIALGVDLRTLRD
ncbi:hypothetical protein FRB99_003727 [Tulasnella sp. 403]|nr:hypothetical protein FRB99_003727 [Tulasnella sp. 403]